MNKISWFLSLVVLLGMGASTALATTEIVDDSLVCKPGYEVTAVEVEPMVPAVPASTVEEPTCEPLSLKDIKETTHWDSECIKTKYSFGDKPYKAGVKITEIPEVPEIPAVYEDQCVIIPDYDFCSILPGTQGEDVPCECAEGDEVIDGLCTTPQAGGGDCEEEEEEEECPIVVSYEKVGIGHGDYLPIFKWDKTLKKMVLDHYKYVAPKTIKGHTIHFGMYNKVETEDCPDEEPTDFCSILPGVQGEDVPCECAEGDEVIDGVCTTPTPVDPEPTPVKRGGGGKCLNCDDKKDPVEEEEEEEEETPAPTTPSVVKACPRMIEGFIKLGAQNDWRDVVVLQNFLNTHENAGLKYTGFYGPADFNAVKAFQAKYYASVIAPWHTYLPTMGTTGYVFETTRHQINKILCPEKAGPFPMLTM